jgi:hypothetical protein
VIWVDTAQPWTNRRRYKQEILLGAINIRAAPAKSVICEKLFSSKNQSQLVGFFSSNRDVENMKTSSLRGKFLQVQV